MDTPELPLEILVMIACESPHAFRSMLALRPMVEFLRCNREWVLNRFTTVEYKCRNKCYYLAGRLHRDGGLPAVDHEDGTGSWYRYGKLHRDGDLPAIEFGPGYRLWYQKGVLHRDGGLPAVVYADGICTFYKHGVRVESC